MSRLDDILQNKRINDNYYRSAISSIKYPQINADLNYVEKIHFPQIHLYENDFIMAIKKKNLKQIYAIDLSQNIFTKSNFLSNYTVQNIFIDFNSETLYMDAPLSNSKKNLYVSKAYSIYDLFEEPFVFEKDNFRLVVDEESIVLFVDDKETITIKKNDITITELFYNFVIYLYILYISEDSIGIADEKTFFVKSDEQLAIEGLL